MTLCEAMDGKRFDLVVAFCFFSRDLCDMTEDDIAYMLSKPHKWDNEFNAWYQEQ